MLPKILHGVRGQPLSKCHAGLRAPPHHSELIDVEVPCPCSTTKWSVAILDQALTVAVRFLGCSVSKQLFDLHVDGRSVQRFLAQPRSFHVANVTAEMVRPPAMGREFASHHAVDHSRKEYAYHDHKTGYTVSINVSENYYSIFKRGLMGVYHSISEAHLHRYLKQFDFRYNNRSKLGVEDDERAAKTLKGIEGKRLTYYQPRSLAAH